MVEQKLDIVESRDETKSSESLLPAETFAWEPFNTIEDGWRARLAAEYPKAYFQELIQFVDGERA